MSDETSAPEVAERPFRLTQKSDSSWVAPIPWLLEAPLAVVLAYILVTGPLDAAHLIPAAVIAVAMLILALPGLAQFAPEVRAWARRTATIGEDGVTIDMAGHGPRFFPWSGIGSVTTRTLSLGMQFPPVARLLSDFFDPDGVRIPELTIHHSTYRSIVRKAEVNDDGPEVLRELADTPVGKVFDLSTRTFLQVIDGAPDELLDGLSPKSVAEMRAGRLWHARRALDEDKRRDDRIPNALIRVSCVLRKNAQKTAREALIERPGDPFVRYYLAHAILGDVQASVALTEPAAVARRKRHREEARAMLTELAADPVLGAAATRDLELNGTRAFTRGEVTEETEAEQAKERAPRVPRVARPKVEVPKPPPVIRKAKPEEPPPRPVPGVDRIGIFDRPAEPPKRGLGDIVKKRVLPEKKSTPPKK